MKYDVVVAGGGTAGVAAAISAAREGAKTLVVEQNGHLGGIAVSGIPFLGSLDTNGQVVNKGVFLELVEKMKEHGACLGYSTGAYWNTPETPERYQFSLVLYDPEYYKYVAQESVLEAGADILFHTYISDVIKEANSIKAIEVVNKSGKQLIEAKVFVDCTGDADLVNYAGGRFIENNSKQNCSILFRIGNVDLERLIVDLKEGKSIRGWGNWHTRIIKQNKVDQNKPSLVHIAGHMVFDSEEHETTFTAVSMRDGEIFLNATRAAGLSGVDAKDVTKAEIQERRNVMRIFNLMKNNIPAFKEAVLLTTSPIGFRETRNILGDYIITKEDVIGSSRFSDGIARGAYPIDIHDPHGGRTKFTFIQDGGSYEIPYRCLLPKDIEQVIVAGKNISASHEANGSTRIMACVISQGEAAGLAAALSVKSNLSPRNIDVELLRKKLNFAE